MGEGGIFSSDGGEGATGTIQKLNLTCSSPPQPQTPNKGFLLYYLLSSLIHLHLHLHLPPYPPSLPPDLLFVLLRSLLFPDDEQRHTHACANSELGFGVLETFLHISENLLKTKINQSQCTRHVSGCTGEGASWLPDCSLLEKRMAKLPTTKREEREYVGKAGERRRDWYRQRTVMSLEISRP